MIPDVCVTSHIKRKRRTNVEIQRVREAMYDVLAEHQPMTVRQVFYQLVSRGVIDKTESEYRSTVSRLLAQMRRAGDIPFAWIVDHTRMMRKPTTFNGLENCLEETAKAYRRTLWHDQDVYVEIWCEKNALSGVLFQITEKWDVPLMVTVGYSSVTFVHSAADTIRAVGKPAFIYHFGDHDPSGCDIRRAVRAALEEYAPDVNMTFELVAVSEGQIAEMRLPTRPTKQSDPRAKRFQGQSVEVDAIPPPKLRELAERCIERHVDQDRLKQTKLIEEQERKTLRAVEAVYANGRGSGA